MAGADEGQDFERVERFYDRLREQVKSENDLYNQRIIWLITMQAFLFATLGLVLQAKLSLNGQGLNFLIDAVFVLIAVTGILVALISRRILKGAVEVLDELGELWQERLDGFGLSETERALFPFVKGRDDRKPKANHWLLRAGNIPHVFVFAWLCFLVILSVSYIVRY